MKFSHILPMVLITIDVGAAIVYLISDGDWKRAGYWLSAAAISIFATIM